MIAPKLIIEAEPYVSGNMVSLVFASTATSHAPSGRLTLKIGITNPGRETIRLKDLTVSFIGLPVVASTTIPLRILALDGDETPVWTPVEVDAGMTVWWFCNKQTPIVLPMPAAGRIALGITAEGFDDPVTLEIPLAPHVSPAVPAGSCFPARAIDLRSGECWAGTRAEPLLVGDDDQHLAYDLHVVGWDPAKRAWSPLLPGTTGDANEHYRIWGKPIIAMAHGTVVSFECDVAESSGPGTPATTCSPAEGNHFYIQHGDELVLYAHLQPGSLAPALLRKGAIVSPGDILGLAGNSGSSSCPRLRIHSLQTIDPWREVAVAASPEGASWPRYRPRPVGLHRSMDRDGWSAPERAGPWRNRPRQGVLGCS